MTKIFVSYRRKSSSFALLVAEKLKEQIKTEIFVDFQSIDETDFDRAILKHLKESTVFLLMITEHTFAERIHRDNDWVRKEIREALTNKIPIILVCENGQLPPNDLPDDIQEIRRKQGINFYSEYLDAAVSSLIDFLGKVAQIQRKTTESKSKEYPIAPDETGTFDIQQTKIDDSSASKILLKVFEAEHKRDFARALFLAEELKNIGHKFSFDIEGFLKKLRIEVKRSEDIRLATIAYNDIVSIAKSRKAPDSVFTSFNQWRNDYPEYIQELDTENFAQQLDDGKKVIKGRLKPQLRKNQAFLPQPFDWCYIPLGNIFVEMNKGGAIFQGVPAYYMSKYPVTNAQFQVFIEDKKNGYSNAKWWDHADPRFLENKTPAAPRFNDATRPREMVNWYEALAFAKWLSFHSGVEITLPTRREQIRALQGNDYWKFPWGNTFKPSLCNTRENMLKVTTSVDKYSLGASPFGVMDLCGNVWEWGHPNYEIHKPTLLDEKQEMYGGSFRGRRKHASAGFVREQKPDFRAPDVGFRLCIQIK